MGRERAGGRAPGQKPDPEETSKAGTCISEEQLARLVERGVDAACSGSVEQHLADCETCRGILADQVLDRLPGEPPTIQAVEPAPTWRAWLGLLPRPASLTATAVLVLAGLTVAAAPMIYLAVREIAAPVARPEADPRYHGGTRPRGVAASRHSPGQAPELLVVESPALRHAGEPKELPEAPLRQDLKPEREEPRAHYRPSSRRAFTSHAARGPSVGRALPQAVPPSPGAGTRLTVALRTSSSRGRGEREAAEELFVEGVVHYQARRYLQAMKSFDRLLVLGPGSDLADMARRWRAKSLAEARGECQPGFIRRVYIDSPEAMESPGGRQGPTLHEDCVPLD